MMRNRLQALTLRGFKTIEEVESFEPGDLTVLIGPNGAGKSNFISFFRVLSWALTPPGNLQVHVAELGGASAILHDGPARTREIEAQLTMRTDAGSNQYAFRLAFAAGDSLIYTDERFRFSRSSIGQEAPWTELGAGHREPAIIARADSGDTTAKTIHYMLRKVITHQFHNTSSTARLRSKWSSEDSRWLKEDAGNIAPLLLRLRDTEPASYSRIVQTIQQILPFFSDFELRPDHGRVLLAWREVNCDRVFDASQAADGMLRILALVTLLLQPAQDLPDVLILDEPELGLHPYAVNVIGGLIKSASTQVQVVVATQSTGLLDCFEPGDVVVVERRGRASTLRRLEEAPLRNWLEEYALSELWEKNILGGRP